MEEDRELEGGTSSHQTREDGENGSQSPRKKSLDDGQIAKGTEEKVFEKPVHHLNIKELHILHLLRWSPSSP